MTIKTLVIDDEPLARARITKLLESSADIEILGECNNGREALKNIQAKQPDLIFLDIQMPDLNGFDVVEAMPKGHLPFIIFVTAYDQYAIKAFDVKAVDYLLKPYDNERFFQALDYARQQIEQKNKAALIPPQTNNTKDKHHTIEIKDKGRVFEIDIASIFYCESQGNYVQFFLQSTNYLQRQTLQRVKNSFESGDFFQIHRSILINTNHIKKINYIGNNQYEFVLLNDVKLQSGRGFKQEIVTFLNKHTEL